MIFYRLQDYQDKNPVKGQSFSTDKPIYKLNRVSGELENTGEILNIQEVIQSCVNTTLDKLLERFMPEDLLVSELICEREELKDDLDCMQESFLRADEIRARYKLSDDMPVKDVFEFAKEQYNLAGKRFNELNEKNKKGGIKDEEKENKPETKQEAVSESGTKSETPQPEKSSS